MSAPLRLAVVIPTKDRPGFLPQAIASVMAALPEGGEVLVVDDGGTVDLALLLPADIRIMRNGGAQGPAGARNFAVAAVDADIILFLDDDDLLVPGYAAYIAALAARRPDIGYGFSTTRSFADGEVPELAPFPADAGGQELTGLAFRRQLAGLGCGFWIRADVFNAVGGIAEDLRVNEDTDFSLRLLSAGWCGWRADVTGVMIRRHLAGGNNLGHATRRATAAERAGYFAAIIDRHRAYLAGRPDARGHLLGRLIKLRGRAGQIAQARAAIRDPLANGIRLRLWLIFVVSLLVPPKR